MAPAMVFALSACDVDVNDPGAVPDVDVEGGRAPDIDVTPPDVDIKSQEKEIDVPTDVDIKTEPRTIKVPDVDITPADENEPANNE
jgi:hypothetical protein